MFVTAGVADVFELARAMDVEPRTAATLFEHFNPGLTLRARVDRMLDAEWSKPSWELTMARKDARLMEGEAALAARSLHVLPAIAARMDQLIAAGHGNADWTIIAKDAIEGESTRR